MISRFHSTILLFLILIAGCTMKSGRSHTFINITLNEELKIKEIAEDVFLVIHTFPWPANSLLVKTGKNSFFWADTPYTPEATEVVLNWLKENYGKNVDIVEINTGFHIDNLGGNETLIKNNIRVYGSYITPKLIDEKNPQTMQTMSNWLSGEKNRAYREVYENFIFSKPTSLYPLTSETVLKSGKHEARIFFPGVSHTPDNVVVYFPDKKILFGGCMVLNLNAKKPGYSANGDINLWGESLEKVKRRFPDLKIVVPGHGDPGDTSLLEHSIKVLKEVSVNH